jgi:hypothetical protein
VSLELYGAGPAGAAERKITADTAFITNTEQNNILNRAQSSGGSHYWITLVGALCHRILVLEKNVTIDGENTLFHSSGGSHDNGTHWEKSNTVGMILVGREATLIMRGHAKITGFLSTATAMENAVPIFIQGYPLGSGKYSKAYFYMQGGIIAGNVFGDRYGVVVLGQNGANATHSFFVYTGGVVSGNTQNRVTAQDGTVRWTMPQ